MTQEEHAARRQADIERRVLLTGLAAAFLPALMPQAVAQAADVPGGDAFLDISKVLTGRASLDAEQAARLREALVADDPRFEGEIRALLALVNDRSIDAADLQRTLDAEDSALASLPRRIMTAWYTGVVGEGASARCVTFESSLMHQLVADRLNPPSYRHGGHGSWTDTPA